MTSVGLDPANVARSLEQAAIALPLTPDALATSLPELVRGSSTPSFSVDAKIDEAKPAVAALRGRDIVGLVRLRGAVTVRAR
jgi:hypothetical protein